MHAQFEQPTAKEKSNNIIVSIVILVWMNGIHKVRNHSNHYNYYDVHIVVVIR